MIPDSVAEAVAAEILDIGIRSPNDCKGIRPMEDRHCPKSLRLNQAQTRKLLLREIRQLRSQLTVLLPTTWQCPAPKTSLRLAEESGTVSSATEVSGDSHSSALPEISTQNALSIPENPDFTNVLFIGDSRTAGLSEYGDLGQAEVFADSGMSVFNLFDSRIKTKSREQADIKGSFVSKAISNHLPDAGNQ